MLYSPWALFKSDSDKLEKVHKKVIGVAESRNSDLWRIEGRDVLSREGKACRGKAVTGSLFLNI